MSVCGGSCNNVLIRLKQFLCNFWFNAEPFVMASEERIPFLGEEEQEVTEVQVASENDDRHQNIDASKLLGNLQAQSETGPCEKNESVIEQGGCEVNTKGDEDTIEEASNVSSVANEPASEVVDSTSDPIDGVKNSSEVDTSASKQVDVTGEKPVDDKQDTTITGEVEINVTVTEEGVPSTSSETQSADDKAKESAVFYSHVLLVHGLPPREAGVRVLYQLTMWCFCHHI